MSSKVNFGIVFIVVYAVYHLTLFPSVPGGDSGELLAESCLTGTPHPPGYPLFTVLSFIVGHFKVPRVQLISFSPVISFDATVAWQVNNMCAVFGALAASFVYASTVLLSEAGLSQCNFSFIGAIGAFLFAFSPLVWEYSTTAEVFALNNLLCAVMIYLTCHVLTLVRQWKASVSEDTSSGGEQTMDSHHKKSNALAKRIGTMTLWGALVSGLALSNQHASLLQVVYLVPYIAGVLWVAEVPNFWSLLIKSGVCFLCGLSPYAYLVIASHTPTPGTWGDMTTLKGFLTHVLRSEYGTFRLGFIEGSETAFERFSIYCQYVSAESFHVVFPLALLAVLCAARHAFTEEKKSAAETNTISPKKQSRTKGAAVASSSSQNNHNRNVGTNKYRSVAQALFGTDSQQIVFALLGSWVFYLAVWNGVLSNLPLSAPMPFAVHSRFWMQPNITLYILASCGCCSVWSWFAGLLGSVDKQLHSAPSFLSLVTELSVLVGVVVAVVGSRFGSQDRSRTGNVIHQYAHLALSSLPQDSLLLSHTDLDWNPVRYLQHCESARPDVTQLSFQLMPYPWFPVKQAVLYPHLVFPDTHFKGVSTERSSEGNAALILRFLHANNIRQHVLGGVGGLNISSVFPGGVYLDMQAVNEAEIQALGSWRGLTLVPWGTVYRVFGDATKPTLSKHQHLHRESLQRLRSLDAGFPTVDHKFISQYPAGSWEFAAASVFYDAHYQFGLSLLTFSMELQRDIKVEVLPLLLDRLLCAATALTKAQRAAATFKTISSPLKDLHKNSALAWMRLHALLGVISQHQEAAVKTLNKQHRNNKLYFLDPDAVFSLLTREGVMEAQDTAIELIGSFLENHPQDKDVSPFKHTLDLLKGARQ